MALRRPKPSPLRRPSLTAAAAPVDITSKAQVERIRKRMQTWQPEAWMGFKAIGEIGHTLTYRANVISKVRLFAAIAPDDDEHPIPVAAAAEPADDRPALLSPAQAALADATMARLDQGVGIPAMLHKCSLNLDVPGEVHVIGEQRGDTEWWAAYSNDEIDSKGGRLLVKEYAADDKGRTVENAVAFRMWSPDPQYSGQAISSLRPLVEEGLIEELLLISRELRAGNKSRISKGLLLVSGGLNFGAARSNGTRARADDPEAPTFQDELIEFMTTPIASEGTASEVAPGVIEIPASFDPDKAMRRIDLGQPIDANTIDRARYVVERLAQGINMPKEITLGLGDTNHWSSATIERGAFRAYMEPTVLSICHGFTVGFLRPRLAAAGMDPALVERIVVWYDPDDALTPEDKVEVATRGVELGAVSRSVWRREARFDEEDAPDEEELLKFRTLDRGIFTADLTLALMKFLQLVDQGLVLVDSTPPDQVGPRTPAPVELPPAPTEPPEPDSLTASALDLGERLAEIDRRLFDRLHAAAETALEHAVERAGNRIRNMANRDPRARSAAAAVQGASVAAVLGRQWVQRLANTDDDEATVALLLAGSFDGLRERADMMVQRAQRAAVATMAADLPAPQRAVVEAEQDEDRDRALTLLVALLVALAAARLFDPAPEAVDGEFDPSTFVPAVTIREVLAVAGGAVTVERSNVGGLAVDGRPVGGVATGERARTLSATVGLPWVGYRWVYGDPSTRHQPFEPHRALDGRTFARWDSAELASETPWLPETTYRPGDHRGCRCSFTPVLAAAREEAA